MKEHISEKLGFVGESNKGMREKGKGKAKAAPKKVNKKIYVTFKELKRALKKCKNEEDTLRLGLIYFAKAVLILIIRNLRIRLLSHTEKYQN